MDTLRIYIPFNMVVDTDFGMIRLIEETQKVQPYSVNKLKSFLLKRRNENPIPEYTYLRHLEVSEFTYDVILEKYYKNILPLSEITDIMAFIINTHKLGFSGQVEITVGCDYECEKEYLESILSNLNYSIDIGMNTIIKINKFDYIFTKYMDEFYVDYILNNMKLEAKNIYVADYNFNTISDNKNNKCIDPFLHMRLESKGNRLFLVSLYNKKQDGGN